MKSSKYLALATVFGVVTFALLAVDTATVIEKPISAPTTTKVAAPTAQVAPR